MEMPAACSWQIYHGGEREQISNHINKAGLLIVEASSVRLW